jgi:3-hydroxybutyrate dehydrogenase
MCGLLHIGISVTAYPEPFQTGQFRNCLKSIDRSLVQKQVDARAASNQISIEQAKRELLLEKQPSGEFVTPEQLGALAVFLCSDAAAQVRGVAWNMDGGWVAQ